jgi:hypothetical protein
MVIRKKRRGKGGKERRRREEEGKRKGPYLDACRDGAPSRSQKFFASGGACGGLVRTVLFARFAGKTAVLSGGPGSSVKLNSMKYNLTNLAIQRIGLDLP